MAADLQEKASQIEGRARELPVCGGKRGTARASGRGDVLWKMNGIHASTGQRLIGILHQPDAVVAIHNHVGGDDGPLAVIRLRGVLAIPHHGLWHNRCRIAETIVIQVNPMHGFLIGKPLHLWERLIPVKIGIVHKGISGLPETQRIDVRKVVRVGMHGGEEATQRQQSCRRLYQPCLNSSGSLKPFCQVR